MELAFATKALRALCEQEGAAVEKFGDDLAADLKARIADLRAAESIGDIVAGSPRIFTEDDPRVIISIMDKLDMVVRPNHVQPPRVGGGEVDWNRVRRVRIDQLVPRAGGDSQ